MIDFLWVDDAVSALVRAALLPRADFAVAGLVPADDREPGFFVTLNVGTGQGTPITLLAERVREAVGNPIGIQLQPARAAEVERFVADVSRMRTTLGVNPAAPLAHLPLLARQTVRRLAGEAVTEAEAHTRLA